MYTYNISKVADNRMFEEICKEIEKSNGGLIKDKPLIDVDGSISQTYHKDGKKITVSNDYEVDAVYIDSEIELQI